MKAAARILRSDLDALEIGSQGQGGRDDERSFAFLTMEPNACCADPSESYPVILTRREEIDLCLTAPTKDPMTLQRPLADDALRSREARDKTGRAKGEGRNLQARTSFSRAAAIDPCRP